MIAQVLYEEIIIHHELNNKFIAYENYSKLCSEYTENDYVNQAQKIIDEIMPELIENAKFYQKNQSYQKALENFLYLQNNPTKYKEKIKKEIADTYFLMAEAEINNEDFLQAKTYFQKSINWNRDKKDLADKRLKEIANKFIMKGDQLVREEKIELAIENYKAVFDIFPQHKEAQESIQKANEIKERFEQARQLYLKAQRYEKMKKYSTALSHYKQSYNLHKVKEIRKDIIHMNNLILANRDPQGFAKSIILGYKNNKINNEINKIITSLKEQYGNEVEASGWRVMYSFGKYNYEIRYDILTPEENQYFLWKVNLENREIVPLNKISKEIMGK